MSNRGFNVGIALLFTGIAFLVLTLGVVPALQYLPVEHRWTFEVPHGTIGMDWYFRAGMSFVCGAVGFALAQPIGARIPERSRPGAARFALGLGIAALGWAALYMVFALVSTPRGR